MCHHSLKSKECPYEKCKFYHVKGTKFVDTTRHESEGDVNRLKRKETSVSEYIES